jgi:hypothetical protein
MSETDAQKRRPSALAWLAVVLLSPFWIPWVVVALLGFALYAAVLYLCIWLFWLPRGKDVLLVYSESPIWQDYMVSEVLPLVKERARVLNWSERSKWRDWSLSVLAFRFFGGRYAFNPMVVVFRPLSRARTFRFWPAFKEWKHGDREPVEKLRRELFLLL